MCIVATELRLTNATLKHLLTAVNELRNQTSYDHMDCFGALFLKEVISSICNTCRIVALLVHLCAVCPSSVGSVSRSILINLYTINYILKTIFNSVKSSFH